MLLCCITLMIFLRQTTRRFRAYCPCAPPLCRSCTHPHTLSFTMPGSLQCHQSHTCLPVAMVAERRPKPFALNDEGFFSSDGSSKAWPVKCHLKRVHMCLLHTTHTHAEKYFVVMDLLFG